MMVHILFSYYDSPIAITYPKVKAVYTNKKEAYNESNRLNTSPYTNRYHYYVKSIKVKEKDD